MKIIENIKMKDRASVMDAIRSYWRLKRKARNDIPILRRLQVASLIQAMGMVSCLELPEANLLVRQVSETSNLYQLPLMFWSCLFK